MTFDQIYKTFLLIVFKNYSLLLVLNLFKSRIANMYIYVCRVEWICWELLPNMILSLGCPFHMTVKIKKNCSEWNFVAMPKSIGSVPQKKSKNISNKVCHKVTSIHKYIFFTKQINSLHTFGNPMENLVLGFYFHEISSLPKKINN